MSTPRVCANWRTEGLARQAAPVSGAMAGAAASGGGGATRFCSAASAGGTAADMDAGDSVAEASVGADASGAESKVCAPFTAGSSSRISAPSDTVSPAFRRISFTMPADGLTRLYIDFDHRHIFVIADIRYFHFQKLAHYGILNRKRIRFIRVDLIFFKRINDHARLNGALVRKRLERGYRHPITVHLKEVA